MVMYELQVKKFEAFRPTLEEMIKEGRLVDYMSGRLQVDTSDFSNAPSPLTNTTPSLEFLSGEYEDPRDIFKHFSGRSWNKAGLYKVLWGTCPHNKLYFWTWKQASEAI